MGYLAKFGYIKASTSGKTAALQSLDSAIADFQAFAGLEQTGELDEETVKMMHTPRCGVKDFLEEDEDTPSPNHRMRLRNSRRRGKRYALQGSRWKVKDLTYRVSKYPVKSRLTRREVDDTMRRAFDIWEKEEDWTVNTHRGTSLLMTASHELGHSLGLSHSNVRSSLMAPFYRGYDSNLSLENDDIRGIQALYGEKSGTSSNEIGVRSSFPSISTTRRTTTTARTTRRPSF